VITFTIQILPLDKIKGLFYNVPMTETHVTDWTIKGGYLVVEVPTDHVVFDCVSDGAGGFWWWDGEIEHHIIHVFDTPGSITLDELFATAKKELDGYNSWLVRVSGHYGDQFKKYLIYESQFDNRGE
jgi:hypothetical protein